MIYDTIIIGAGPAGIAASVQLKRCGFKPLVLEKNKIGGLIANAGLIENYSGFPNGISGKKIVGLFQKQLKNHNMPVKMLEVTGISRHGDIFNVKTTKERFFCRSLIIASGTIPKRLGCPMEKCLAGKKVFYELHEIPNLDKKKSVIIAGSGDIAFDYALSLAKSFRVKIIFRGSAPKCIPLLYKSAQKKQRIKLFPNTIIRKITLSTPQVARVELSTENKKWSLSSDYVLIAIGREPNLGFLPLTWQKTLKKDPKALESRGIYIAGDADRHNLRYVSIAAGHGLSAAMNIGRNYLIGKLPKEGQSPSFESN